jgi:short-subunit dehydrogenase
MSSYWNNKTCLVTGASAGLGLAIARALAAHGATVLLTARDEKRLQQAVENLQASGGSAFALPADVTCQEDIDRLAAAVRRDFGGLDFLCNGAGRSTRRRVLETTVEEFQSLWELNFLATVRTTRAFADLLLARRGHLVNIGSLAGKVAPRYLGAYPASKHALSAYCQQLRLELEPEGLNVLLVCPGPIRRDDDTPRYATEAPDVPASAQAPGGGAKLKGLDPAWLAERILTACQRRESELVVPAKARLLLALSQLSPRWGDWLLGKFMGG